MTRLEQDWVAYALDLLDNHEHLQRCREEGGSPVGELDPMQRLDPDLRWPGYLGRNYRTGGVLCVATVHRDFETNGAGRTVRTDIVDATCALRDRTIEGRDYLDSVRRGYEAGLAKWVVGGNLGRTLAALGVSISEIAYVNAARCQVPEDWSHLDDTVARRAAKKACNKIKAQVLECCWADYPVTDLISLVRPTFVLFANAPTYDRAAPTAALAHIPATCIHPWQGAAGTLLRPLGVGAQLYPPGTRLAEWSPAIQTLLTNRPA